MSHDLSTIIQPPTGPIAIAPSTASSNPAEAADGIETTSTVTARAFPLLGYGSKIPVSRIVEQVVQTLNASIAWVVLYDPVKTEFVVQPESFCADQPAIGLSWPLNGGGVAAHVFCSGEPYMTNDIANDPILLKYLVKAFRATNVIVVPLEIDNCRIGTLFVGNKRSGDFTEFDMQMTSLLAAHLSVLIHNDRLLDREQETIEKLTMLNQVNCRQRELLERSLAIHDEFTRMVLEGEDIPAIVATLSRMVDNPAILEDRYGRIITHYPERDEGNLDEEWRLCLVNGGTPQAVRDSRWGQEMRTRIERERCAISLAPVPEIGLEKPRVMASVVAGREPLGYLYVLESTHHLDEFDIMAIERAATAIALSMLKERAAVEAQYKVRGDFVMEMLRGNYGSDEMLLKRAAYLDIDLMVARAVMVVDVDDFAGLANRKQSEEKVLTLKSRLLKLVERACRWAAPKAVFVDRSDEIIILAMAEGNGTPTQRMDLEGLGDFLRAEVRAFLPELSVSIGIGSVSSVPSQYRQSYQNARQALEVIKATGQADVTLDSRRLRMMGLIFDPHHRDKLVALLQDMLGKLKDYDQRHEGQLLETLDEYLRQDCHIERSAAALSIHVNTLRRRILRIERILGIDLRDVEEKLDLQIALRARRALGRRDCLRIS